MVGAILSKVLSVTKLSIKAQARNTLTPVSDHSIPQGNTSADNMQQIQQIGAVGEKRSSISFDKDAKSTPSPNITRHSTPRKHSYASVKEDSELPQSFSVRKLQRRRRSGQSMDKAELDLEVSEDILDSFTDSELAVSDSDDDLAIYSDSDSASIQSFSSANLSTMPEEILDLIFSLLTLTADKDRFADPRVDLFNLLFVSRSVHASALRVLYRHVCVPQSKAFFKFHNALMEDTHLGSLVKCLDFSHYSSIGFGRARSTTVEKPYLTPKTLKACLDKTINLRALLAHEHIDDELDVAVLSKLFSMPSLQALDLCSCSSKPFTESMNLVCSQMSTSFLSIERLSLHECTILRPQVFEAILPRLNRLTHLDVAHTMVNDKALMSIPPMARLTHLNLERCTQITGPGVVKFLTTHPAATNSMIYLNLMADASRYRLLSEDDLSTLLPALPDTLRSLNIGGARTNSSHVCQLRKLATHLEELGLKGANLSLNFDIMHILSQVSIACDEELEHPEWRHSLRYIDLTDIKSVNQMSLNYSPTPITRIETMPLEVVELGETVMKDTIKRLKNVKDPEWRASELGRRGWYVRQARLVTESIGRPEDGHRSWKMGAKWWGMRKIPIFEQDTSGMYGYFMFKRA